MAADPAPISADRAALVESAAQWLADRPHTQVPIPTLIAEFELSVSEACRAAGLATNMRACRAAFA